LQLSPPKLVAVPEVLAEPPDLAAATSAMHQCRLVCRIFCRPFFRFPPNTLQTSAMRQPPFRSPPNTLQWHPFLLVCTFSTRTPAMALFFLPIGMCLEAKRWMQANSHKPYARLMLTSGAGLHTTNYWMPLPLMK
jgi:hypothetical protein